MRILWIKTELLHPIDKGGKIRTYAMLRELRREHHVTYLTLDDGSAAPDAAERAMEYCHELVRIPFHPTRRGSAGFFVDLLANLASRLPYAVARYRSSAMAQAIRAQVARGAVDVIVCDFLAPSLNVPDGLGVPTILFQHNVEAAIWQRHASVATHPLKRAYFGSQWRRMQAWEARECARFDHVIAVSEADRDAMRKDYGVTAVSAVPTGVDTEYFTPRGTEPRRPMELVFTGSMDWMPNQDGIAWLCAEVMPLVHERFPAATLAVVGRNPSASLVALPERLPWVTVTGTVPDIRPYLERAGVLLVPLRVGGGTRLKIFEGMAMGRPTVSTTIGAEGLPVVSGHDILIADSPADFAAAICHCLDEPGWADRLGAHAAARVRSEFGWEHAGRQFAETCERVAGHRVVLRPGAAAH